MQVKEALKFEMGASVIAFMGTGEGKTHFAREILGDAVTFTCVAADLSQIGFFLTHY